MKKVIARTKNGKMLKIGTDEKDAKWYFLSDAVVEYVASGIKNGDEVTIKYEAKDGKSTINYITKGKGESQQSKPTPTETKTPTYTCEVCGKELKDDKYKKCYECNAKKVSNPKETTQPSTKDEPQYKCIDCGARLKDNKYKKCYTCNQKNPVKTYDSSPTGTARDNLIKREAIGHMTSRSLISLQGHVDPDNIHEIIKKLYTTYLTLIDEK